MSTIINEKNCLALVRGASLFATGGGLSFSEQTKSLKRLGRFSVKLLSLADFPRDARVCLAAELGPANAPPMEKREVIGKMLALLERASGRKISGLYPPEIGQESIVLEAAHFSGLPVADFDPVGFRAVPFLDISTLRLKGLDFSLTPMAAANERGEIFLIDGKISPERLEQILRQMTALSRHGLVFLLGAPLAVGDLLKNGIDTPLYGRALVYAETKSPEQLIRELAPRLVVRGRVAQKKELAVKGFFAEKVTIVDSRKEAFHLLILNESIFLLDRNNKVLSAVPERILLIDFKRMTGLAAGDVKKNQPILILVADPEKIWQGKKAKQIFGPPRFSFLLKSLK